MDEEIKRLAEMIYAKHATPHLSWDRNESLIVHSIELSKLFHANFDDFLSTMREQDELDFPPVQVETDVKEEDVERPS